MKLLKQLMYAACLVVGCLLSLVVLLFRPKTFDAFNPSQKVLYDRFLKNSNSRL